MLAPTSCSSPASLRCGLVFRFQNAALHLKGQVKCCRKGRSEDERGGSTNFPEEGGEGPATSTSGPGWSEGPGLRLGFPCVRHTGGQMYCLSLVSSEKLAQPLACRNFLESAVGLVHLGSGPWPLVGTRPARPSTPGNTSPWKTLATAAAAFWQVWAPVFFKTFTIAP